MYSILYDLIGYSSSSYNESYIIYGSVCLVIIYSVVFIDLIYRIFSHFWRGGK